MFTYENEIKLVLVGDLGCGKSSIRDRFVDNTFDIEQHSTVGVEFANKIVLLANNERCKLQIWDTSGQERFRTVTRQYWQGAHAIFIVLDGSQAFSQESLIKYIDDGVKLISDTEMVVVVNKQDGQDSPFDMQSLQTALDTKKEELESNGIKLSKIYSVSAMTGQNIETMFLEVTEAICVKQAQKKQGPRQPIFLAESTAGNPYFEKIQFYEDEGMNDFDIVVELLRSYNTWIGWKHFKSEITALLTLVDAGYFAGNTKNLIRELKLLPNKRKDAAPGTLALIIEAVEGKKLSEDKTFIESESVAPRQWSKRVVSLFARSQSSQDLLNKYEEIYKKLNNGTATKLQVLIGLLNAYIGSSMSVSLRTHAKSVQAFLTLNAVDPKNKRLTLLGMNATHVYSAILMLKNLDCYDQEQGDLAAMIRVVENHQTYFRSIDPITTIRVGS